MLISHRINAFFSSCNFIWVGIGIALFYWFLESFIHVLFFSGGKIAEQLLTPDIHEIWKRILVISLLVMFGIFAEQYFTLRRHSEKALKESERKYRTIFEQALNPIFLFDERGRLIDNNIAALDFLECSQEDLLTRTFNDISAGKSQKKFPQDSAIIHERKILEIDYNIEDLTKTMLLNLVPLNIEKKNLTYGIGQDISQRKQMERTLKQAHAELDQIFQTASVGMRVVDKYCNVIKINKTFAVMANVTEAEAANKKCYEIFSGPMCHTASCPIARVLQGESYFETYVDKKRSDGKVISSILTATPFSGQDGNVVGIVESFRDITQLNEANHIIQSERDKLQRILAHLLEGVSIVNTDHTIEYQNDILKKDLGNCEGKKCYSIFKNSSEPCQPCLMHKAIQTGESQHIEYETPDGRIFEHAYTKITDIDGNDKAVTILSDITDKKTSLAATMHADRLAAVGELAAGVAHEINNPINGIINYAQIISNKSDKDDIVNNVAECVIKEGNRIAKIVESLLTFSSRQNEGKIIISIKSILDEALTLTSAQMRKDNIILKIVLADNLPKILAHPHEIEQVFINVINNARYALMKKYKHSHNNKILEISTSLIQNNNHVLVRTAFLDHGTGIPANIISKVKNPFFSTKTEGQRTGLGLTISHGIVNSLGGQLTIASTEGSFTRICIDLPVWHEDT